MKTKREKELEKALKIIEEWKLPPTGKFFNDDPTRPLSYEYEWGSEGAKNYMRNIATIALSLPEDDCKTIIKPLVEVMESIIHAHEISTVDWDAMRLAKKLLNEVNKYG